MKVVLDSNVLLAGFGTRGLCDAVIEACMPPNELILCQGILDELAQHLPAKFKMEQAKVRDILRFMRSHCTMVEPLPVAADACRDPDDLMVLGAALAAQADCIVTGDKDLLSLKAYQGIPILSPRAFYQLTV